MKLKIVTRPEGFENWATRATPFQELIDALEKLGNSETVEIPLSSLNAMHTNHKKLKNTIRQRCIKLGFKPRSLEKQGTVYFWSERLNGKKGK